MLTGRESLIRLVGKRRRFLPNRHFIFSTPIQSYLELFEGQKGKNATTQCANGLLEDEMEVSREEEDGKDGAQASASGWVNCPACGNAVCGGDYSINTHLDACLARGTKRKLTQRTLLQLKFCSTSKAKIQLSKSVNSGAGAVQGVPDINLVHSTINKLPDIGSIKEKNSIQCRSPLNLDIMQGRINGSTENPFSDEKINDKIGAPLDNSMPNFDMAITLDNISGAKLDTFIVGRKFSDEEEIHLGASIFLLRDPNNIKDPNAIKVLSSDSGCDKVLGFIPRELAQSLSPLIEKYCLNFKGCVVSVPKHSLEVVPIQIVCEKVVDIDEKDQNLQFFNSLWKNVVLVVESAKTYPPSMAKYQKNFCLLIQEVLRSNLHLFTEDEKIFLESFTSLSDDSQRLFVRLYTRKGPWFRMSNISYPEILNSQEAVEGLSARGYLCSFGSISEIHGDDLKEILIVLTVSELREISSLLEKKCNRGTRKEDIIALLLSSYKEGLCSLLPSLIMDRTGICVRITATAESLIWRAERLFFMNGEQDLSAFLLVDLGIIKYPTYKCIISDQIFPSRSDLLAYEEAIEVAQIMEESLDENKTDLVLRCINISESRISSSAKATQPLKSDPMATFLSSFSASWVYSKVILLGISFLEREHRYKEAITLLKQLLTCFTHGGRRGYWTLRLSIDLEHIGHIDASLSVAEDGLKDPWVRAGSRLALQRRVLRLGKPPRRWKVPEYSKLVKRKITEVHVRGRPLNCEIGMKNRFYDEDGEQCGVEQLALQYYAKEGGEWQGVHTESGIWLTIFGLLMWDIIFSDVPNVFRTKFQTAPLDLETDSFYEVRKCEIESHLQKINDGMGEEILITSWESHTGTACRGVNWDKHSLSEVRAAVTCVGGPCLASLCRHLARDYRSWSSGMPDLLLWRFHDDYKGEAKLVEVKGPRDKLSEQQRAWLLFLMDCGFNTEVCKVSPELI